MHLQAFLGGQLLITSPKVETSRRDVSNVLHPHSHVPAQTALDTLAYVKEYCEAFYHQAFQLR